MNNIVENIKLRGFHFMVPKHKYLNDVSDSPQFMNYKYSIINHYEEIKMDRRNRRDVHPIFVDSILNNYKRDITSSVIESIRKRK
jgi:hypothetical protein